MEHKDRRKVALGDRKLSGVNVLAASSRGRTSKELQSHGPPNDCSLGLGRLRQSLNSNPVIEPTSLLQTASPLCAGTLPLIVVPVAVFSRHPRDGLPLSTHCPLVQCSQSFPALAYSVPDFGALCQLSAGDSVASICVGASIVIEIAAEMGPPRMLKTRKRPSSCMGFVPAMYPASHPMTRSATKL